MAIHNPPYYRYLLSEPWDKEAFNFLKKLGETKNFPKLNGSKEEIDKYLVALFRTQKSLHDWRPILMDTIDQIKKSGTINTKPLLEKYPPESVSEEAPAWVTYEEDKIVNGFIDQLKTKRVEFVGTNEEKSEFILRFILGQLGDWESTILMIWEMLGEKNSLEVNKLNKEMRNFDYLGLFK